MKRQLFGFGFVLVALLVALPRLHSQVDTLAASLNQIGKPGFDVTVLNKLETAADERVDPSLSAAFDRSTDEFEKSHIAVVLVRRHVSDPRFFDYLAKFVLDWFKDPSPPMLQIDASGESVRGAVNPAFEEWCRTRRMTPESEVARRYSELPGYFISLKMTQDQRALPILRKAAIADEPLVATAAIVSLGPFSDPSDIPLILKLGNQLYPDLSLAAAQALSYYLEAGERVTIRRGITNAALAAYYQEFIAASDKLKILQEGHK